VGGLVKLRFFVLILIAFATNLVARPVSARDFVGVATTPWLAEIPGYFHQYGLKSDGLTMDRLTKVVVNRAMRGVYIFELKESFKYKIGSQIGKEGDFTIYEYDMVSRGVSLKPLTISSAGIFWQTQECGLTNWEVNVEVDVSGKICNETRYQNTPWFGDGDYRSYESIGISDKEIRLGSYEADPNRDGTTPARRLQALSKNVYRINP
jgi:hypothetical protein